MSQKSVIATVTRLFSVGDEVVFEAFLNPDQARNFMFSTSTGEIVRAEVDPKVGGRFLFIDRRNGEDVEHHGRFVELDRPRRIVFEFHVPKYAETWDRVEINIVEMDAGSEATIIHEFDASWEEHLDGISDSWMSMLNGLAATVGSE